MVGLGMWLALIGAMIGAMDGPVAWWLLKCFLYFLLFRPRCYECMCAMYYVFCICSLFDMCCLLA